MEREGHDMAHQPGLTPQQESYLSFLRSMQVDRRSDSPASVALRSEIDQDGAKMRDMLTNNFGLDLQDAQTHFTVYAGIRTAAQFLYPLMSTIQYGPEDVIDPIERKRVTFADAARTLKSELRRFEPLFADDQLSPMQELQFEEFKARNERPEGGESLVDGLSMRAHFDELDLKVESKKEYYTIAAGVEAALDLVTSLAQRDADLDISGAATRLFQTYAQLERPVTAISASHAPDTIMPHQSSTPDSIMPPSQPGPDMPGQNEPPQGGVAM